MSFHETFKVILWLPKDDSNKMMWGGLQDDVIEF